MTHSIKDILLPSERTHYNQAYRTRCNLYVEWRDGVKGWKAVNCHKCLKFKTIDELEAAEL